MGQNTLFALPIPQLVGQLPDLPIMFPRPWYWLAITSIKILKQNVQDCWKL